MRARKPFITLAISALFLGAVSICYAVPPQPFLLKAKLIVNGSTLTGDQPYEIKITNTSGTEFTPVDTAGNPFGTPTDGRFSYNIPMYDAEQTGGAQAGTACIQIWQQGGSQLTVSYPAQGACPSGSGAFTIGSPGESIRFGTSLGTTTYQYDTPITATTPANITVSPTSKDYGNVSVSSSSAQTFTVTNTGGSSFTVGTLSFSGTNADQFSKSSDNCSGQAVTGGGSCTVQVTFSPTSTGAKSATFNIPSNAPNNTSLTATLTGTGIEANISVDPTAKNYGAVNVGASSTQTFTVTNSGGASLVIGTVAISGTNSSEFVKGIDTCNGQTVAPSGGTCNIQVTFTPSSAGSKSATLTIPSDDPDTASLDVALTGSVASQNLSADPTNKAFGDVNVGGSSSAQTFTITNTGNVSLGIGTISISGTNASEFATSNDNCDSATVTPGSTCTLQVTFSPTSFGSKSATLSIPSNDPDGTTEVALTGTGLANEINVSPTPLAFGNVVIGQTRNLDITVTNQGNADLTISSVVLAGDPDYSLIQTIADSTVISGGASATITVRLTPIAETSYTGAVTINSDDTDEPTVAVTLSGAGVTAPTAHLTITPSGTIDFGNNDIDQTADDSTNTITVTSDGTLDLVIGTVSLNDTTNYTITSDACSGQTVAYLGSGTCQIVVKFNPTTVGSKAATITVPSNNGNIDGTVDQTSTKNLTGVGIQYGLTVTPSTLNFGTVLLPDNSAGGIGATCADNGNGTVTCAVNLHNTGTQALTSFILGATGSQFGVTPTTIDSLASGATTTAAVTYSAVAGSSAHTGTLTVASGSYSGSVSLTGITNTRPSTPANSSPANAAADVSLTPTLTAASFSDGDSDTHASSTWEVCTDSGCGAATVIFQSTNDTSNLTSITIPPGVLQQHTTYYWRVSYKDSRGAASAASTVTSFTTLTVALAGTTGVTIDTTTVKSGGNEVTTLSTSSLPSSSASVSSRLLADYSAVNCGTTANTATDSVAIVKAKGGIDKDVLGIMTPAGTKIETVSTTVTTDSAFATTPPSTFTFPYGVVSFRITDVTVGASLNVTIYTPADLPSNAVWYKYSPANGWLAINGTGTYNAAGTLLSANTTFTVVDGKGVLSIKDDDAADFSTEVITGKAVIVDPGAAGIPVPAPPSSPAAASSGGGGGGGCFIATAAFGSYFDPYVTILKEFRDTFLLTHSFGKAFVAWYYRTSPPIADYIRTSEPLKAGVRLMLLPAVGFSALSLEVGPVMTFVLFLVILLCTVAALRKCWKYLLQK